MKKVFTICQTEMGLLCDASIFLFFWIILLNFSIVIIYLLPDVSEKGGYVLKGPRLIISSLIKVNWILSCTLEEFRCRTNDMYAKTTCHSAWPYSQLLIVIDVRSCKVRKTQLHTLPRYWSLKRPLTLTGLSIFRVNTFGWPLMSVFVYLRTLRMLSYSA